MKSIYRTYPIERIDDDERVVEGYAFVNEVVPGEGGIRLKRSAMEAATENYLANGTSRELHQPSAAGKPLSVTWDEKGALLRVKVVDDRAWAKVKEGVYKGFSVGVIPEVMRGKDVEKCNWWDTSLVDVGKDKDARFTVWRVESFEPLALSLEEAKSLEYRVLSPAEESFEPLALRLEEAKSLESRVLSPAEESFEPLALSVEEAKSLESRVLSPAEQESVGPLGLSPAEEAVAFATPEDTTHTTQDMPDAQRAFLQGPEPLLLNPPPLCSAQDEGDLSSQAEIDRLHDEIFRMQSLQHDAIARAEAAEANVRELGRMPRSQRPVIVAELVGRAFEPGSLDELRSELEEISSLAPTADKQEAERRILEIQRIKRELS